MPILPIYIERIIMLFPASDKDDVIPVDKPTVPNAEISSKSKSTRFLSGSVTDRKNVEIKIREIEKRAIEYALLIVLFEMVCLTISTFCFPFIVLIAERSNTENVVVLIPPPVDPGDAPMNIRNIIKNITGCPKLLKSTVLNPAVRQVTD